MGWTLAAIFLTASNATGLPAGLLASVCYVESGYNTAAYTPDDGGRASVGVCQVQERTARAMGYDGDSDTLYLDPEVNALYAAKYLRFQLDRYGGDTIKAVAAYNLGHYKEVAPEIPVNAEYVVKVLQTWRATR